MQLTTGQSERISASTFLVTGGAGFIGSHIAEGLLNAGARKVTVLDNLETGYFRNVAPFANHPRFEFIKGDIRDPDICKAACKGMDYVFHEAAVHPTGFFNMLGAAHDAKIKRFVYASDSSMYGQNGDLFARHHVMETIGLQYFNVFGKRQDPRSGYADIIPKLVMQLRRHESPVVETTGEYSHHFTYVENVVQANVLAMLATDSKAVNQVYHIAFKERTSLHQLARYLKEFLSEFDESIAGIKIIHKPGHGVIARSVAYVQKARRLLGFQPAYSLRDGLLQSAAWYWTYLQLHNFTYNKK